MFDPKVGSALVFVLRLLPHEMGLSVTHRGSNKQLKQRYIYLCSDYLLLCWIICPRIDPPNLARKHHEA